MKIVAVDVGGTNTRFGLFNCLNNQLVLEEVQWFSSQGAKSFEEIYGNLVKNHPNFDKNVYSIGIAAAGMKQSDTLIQPTNIDWSVNINTLHSLFPTLPQTFLVNDFEAQAYACVSSLSQNFTLLYKGDKNKEMSCPMGIIGAGTGLGYAGLFLHKNEYFFMPSELGQQTFFFHPQDETEDEFAKFLCSAKNIPYARGDDVLSGSGLELAHQFLTGERLKASDIPFSSPAYTYFSIWYGRAVRNLAFAFLPETIVISGGIGAKHPEIFNETFFNSYFSAYIYSEKLRNIDIYLNREENAALWGVAFALFCNLI